MPPRPLGAAGAAVALAVAVPVALGGCAATSAPEPTPSQTETSMTAALFEPEEATLARAAEVLESYVRVVDEIGRDGGSRPERAAEVATARELEEVLDSFEQMRDEGVHFEGRTIIDQVELIEWTSGSPTAVQVDFCLDLSDARLVAKGEDITPSRARSRIPYEGTLVNGGTGRLVLERSERRPAEASC